MLKQFKNGGTVVIDKSHKSLYRTPISCMEYFNAFALMRGCFSILPMYALVNHITPFIILNTSSKKVVCFLFPKIYVDITLETC